jgi:hypothetical protein
MSNKKQTAVEWLVEQFNLQAYTPHIEQAKAMEKEQIIEAFDEGQEYEYQYHINSTPKFYSETYYRETYGE